jgi:hypothetical protein
VATKALNGVSGYLAIFLSIVNVFDLLLKEALLLRAEISFYVVLG